MAAIRRRITPARTILVAFFIALIIGTSLLMLPFSTVASGGIPLLEALFTATSALCVTGLSTVDTATYWTGAGHLIIAALIQIGGFGVMSFATILGLTVVRKANFGANIVSAAEHRLSPGQAGPLLWRIAATSLIIEGAVALALVIRFFTLGNGLARSTWLGIFHAVSSFNNAGFALFTGNLEQFVGDWWICVPIMISIILGGLGFPVLFQLRKDLPRPHAWSLHTRMVLTGTAFLLVFSTLVITAGEWANPATLGELPTPTKILAGAFQAVQTRTAGFNSVDVGQMHDSTLLAMDVFMFIGGGPAGTAGGIKITTTMVIIALVVAEARSRKNVNILGKSVAPEVYRQAISVAALSVALVMVATYAILIVTEFELGDVLFEACSAFGTVGLSTGITGALNAPAQLIIIGLMIFGRLGPITVATALAARPNDARTALPKERPIIG